MLTRGSKPTTFDFRVASTFGFIYPLIVRTSDFRVGEEFDLFFSGLDSNNEWISLLRAAIDFGI